MKRARRGDTVRLALKGYLDDGQVIERYTAKKPYQARLGHSRLFPALEDAVVGMVEGEHKTVHLPPEQAYGMRHKDLVHTVNRSVFGSKVEPKPGMILALSLERDGREEQVPATIVEVSGGVVTVDYNHPYAGKPVTYEVTLLKILPASSRSRSAPGR